MEPVTYPEHEKLEAVAETSQQIGEFLEWMNQDRGWSLCVWSEEFDEILHWPQVLNSPWSVFYTEPSETVHGPPDLRRHEMQPQWLPVPGSIADKLALYFGIDQKVLETEKRAMLTAIRAAQ